MLLNHSVSIVSIANHYEIETEDSLEILNQQNRRVNISGEIVKEGHNSCISHMIASQIENYILLSKKQHQDL